MKLVTCAKDDKSQARRCDLVLDGANEVVIPTPACLLHTRQGLVPEMTIDLWEELDDLPGIYHAPLNTLLDKEAKLQTQNGGVSELARLPSTRPVFLTQTDPALKAGSFGNTKNEVSVWGKGGRFGLSTGAFSRFVRLAKPRLCQLMADTETPVEVGRKRCSKAVDRTMKFTEQVLHDLEEHISAGSIAPFGSVVGGWDLAERSRCAVFMGKLVGLQGFVLDGFRSLKMRSLKLVDNPDLSALLSESLRPLPTNKPRFLLAVGSPADVVRAVQLGCDLFDGIFPSLLTEAGWAWNFEHEEEWIDFSESRFLQDFSPISSSCSCFACREHTRSYVSHLVTTREILGKTLLMLHNSQQYFRFFKELRRAIDENRLDSFAGPLLRRLCPADIFYFPQNGAGDG